MKKLIFLFLIIASTISADPFRFYSYGELSYYLNKVDSIYIMNEMYFDASLAAGIEKQLYRDITAYTEAELYTDMTKADGIEFKPVQQNYYVRAGVWFGPFTLGYEHLCRHSVDKRDYRINGGHDKISIGFDSRRSFNE